tara:strand:- start:104 stop:985 length:882 start_codon:yes stop_codon:yes gene_type:complete
MLQLQSIFKSSEKIANLLPSLLSESSLLLKNIYFGLHNTRFPGKGENFWQFKEYSSGESISDIDWRKSASSRKVLIKQNEKELAKTIYLFFDKSFSMNYTSKLAKNSKLYYAALITITLTKLYSSSKEKVFIFNNDNKPIDCSNNIKNFNYNFLLNTKNHSFPNLNSFKNNSFCIFLSDFLYDANDLQTLMYKFKSRGIAGYLIQILDPMEVNLDFDAHSRLKDLETKEAMVVEKDINFSNEYKLKLEKLQKFLKDTALKCSWKFTKYYTNEDTSKFLLNLSKTIILNKQETL